MIALVALLCAVAAWLAMGKPPEARVERMFGQPDVRPQEPLPHWLRAGCAVMFGAGIAVVFGSIVGVALGVGGGFAVHHLIGRLEPRASRDRRIAISRQLPQVADLLAATLASGAPPGRACGAVATAVDEPLCSILGWVRGSLALGATAADAWQSADPDGSLASISTAFIRSDSSGAPIADVLATTAADLRRRHRREVEVAARSAGVRAVAPLAACFLPAFLLVGTVPVIASMAEGVLGI